MIIDLHTKKRLMRKTKKDLIQMLCDIRFVEEMMGYGYTFKQVIEGGEKLDPIRTARIKSLFENDKLRIAFETKYYSAKCSSEPGQEDTFTK